ncbi:MAG: DNA-processing protein DprA [Acidimicrobiales bacterium]
MTRPLELPSAAWVAALAGLPGMGPVRLAALLRRWAPQEAWGRVRAGDAHLDPQVAADARRLDASVVAAWQMASTGIDVSQAWLANVEAGVGVVSRGDAAYPAPLVDDPEPPTVLFHLGRLGVLGRPRVAVVGTRRCTYAGRTTAHELGYDLAAAGVCVVSGLASGIDGAAHTGALAAGGAPPLAVVGTGLDVVYPRRNADLWAHVATAGCVVSEYPLGTRPDTWRFPARNRIIAGLADVVVVVESHARGGAMHTVDAALERDRPVMVVPGPVRSSASAGTNDLLAAGSAPVRDAGDVLVALGLGSGVAGRGRFDPRPPPNPLGSRILEAMGWHPATIEQVTERLDQPLGEVAVELSNLERQRWLVRHGSWFDRAGA